MNKWRWLTSNGRRLVMLGVILTGLLGLGAGASAMRPADAPIPEGTVFDANASTMEELPAVKMPKKKAIARPGLPPENEIKTGKMKRDGKVKKPILTPENEILHVQTPE